MQDRLYKVLLIVKPDNVTCDFLNFEVIFEIDKKLLIYGAIHLHN